MRRNLSTRRLRQEKLLCYLTREPVLHAASNRLSSLSPSLSTFVHVYEHLYTYVSPRIYATDLFGHYSRYAALSGSLYPRGSSIILKQPLAFCSNTPGALMFPALRTYTCIARSAAQRGKLLLSFRGITLVATYPTLSSCPLVEKSTTGHEKGSPSSSA